MTIGDWTEKQGEDFRRQLTLPQQKQLFDYWLSHCEQGQLPRREAIHPIHIRQLVSNLLLLEMRPLPEGVRVRLAGSGTWDIYDGELTGATLMDKRWGRHAGYWRRIYTDLHEAPLPASGHLPRYNGRQHMALFWLRLPIRNGDGDIWLLGLDLVAALVVEKVTMDMDDEAQADDTKSVRIPAHGPSLSPPSSDLRPHVVLRRRQQMAGKTSFID